LGGQEAASIVQNIPAARRAGPAPNIPKRPACGPDWPMRMRFRKREARLENHELRCTASSFDTAGFDEPVLRRFSGRDARTGSIAPALSRHSGQIRAWR